MQTPQLMFLRLPDVCRQTGLSRSEIYRRMNADQFPRPVALGPKAVAWSSEDIQQWLAAKLAAAKGHAAEAAAKDRKHRAERAAAARQAP